MISSNGLDWVEIGGISIDMSGHRSTLNSKNSGWYLMRLLVPLSINRANAYLDNYNVHFDPEHLLNNGWFQEFLDQKQISELSRLNEIEFYEAKPVYNEANYGVYSEINGRSSLSTNRDDKFLVRASKDWKFDAGKVMNIGNERYVVSEVTDINKLLDDPNVLYVTRKHQREALNRYLAGYIQSGRNKLDVINNSYRIDRSLYKYGISGSNQTINVVDSGVDHRHCMFYDPNVPMEYDKVMSNHRKIIRYDPWVDKNDAIMGHGSHVCGIALGKALCEGCQLSQYNGVAEDAKLFITDIGRENGGSSDLSGDFSLTDTINRMEAINSRVTSNSWGFSNNPVEERLPYDELSVKHDNITFVFAAGNSGRHLTIHTPGDSKNILTVGISSNAIKEKTLEKQKPVAIDSNNIDNRVVLTEGSASPSYYDRTETDEMKWIENVETIAYESGVEQKLYGKIVLVADDDATCEALSKAEFEKSVAVIGPTELFKCEKSSIPVFYAGSGFGKVFAMKKISIGFDTTSEDIDICEISSRGPSANHILKPDVIAPANPVLSASSNGPYITEPGKCNIKALTSKRGTSMATPAVAGAAALVAQFFEDGFYPMLEKKAENSFVPSSTLVRSVIINSAQPVKKASPDYVYGFGIPVLMDTLPFESGGLRISDRQKIKMGQRHRYSINIGSSKSKRLSISMSYLDHLVQSGTPMFADIDLIVKTPSGSIIYGNQYENGYTEQFSTNERVFISEKNVEKGTYEIDVVCRSSRMDVETQYAIVISGPFEHNDFESNPLLEPILSTECLGGCGKSGTCDNGQCKCPIDRTGPNCQEPIQLFKDTNMHEIKLKSQITTTIGFAVVNLSSSHPFKFISSQASAGYKMFCFSTDTPKPIHGGFCKQQDREPLKVSITPKDLPGLDNTSFVYVGVYANTPIDTTAVVSASPLDGNAVIPEHQRYIKSVIKLVGMGISLAVFIGSGVVLIMLFLGKLKLGESSKHSGEATEEPPLTI